MCTCKLLMVLNFTIYSGKMVFSPLQLRGDLNPFVLPNLMITDTHSIIVNKNRCTIDCMLFLFP